MGRKPNAVVLEFFERGRKLEDASNRYEHTCKRCRAQFPKGRIDALIGHVLRRCLNVTQQERDLVALHLKQSSNRPYLERSLTRDRIHANSEALSLATAVSDHTFAAKQQQSALDTLAEVSRQQLDFSSHLNLLGHERMHAMDDRQGDPLEHTLIMQLERANRDREVESSTDVPGSDNDDGHMQHDRNEAMIGTALSVSPLIRTASAANRRLEQTQHLQTDAHAAPLPALDPQLDLDSGTSDTMSRQSVTLLSEHQPLVTNGAYDASTFTDLHTPFYETGSGYHLTHMKTAKGKPRTRFSDARRKEVREIRKRGACIRCRMLKKSCTDGTPCATCARVESARLWKGGCIRTRIAEQFTLWSAGLFYCLASIAVPAAIQGQEKFTLSGCIEVCFDPGLTAGMTFACAGYCSQDGHAAAGSDVGHLEKVDNLLILLEEEDSIATKIESYVSSVREFWINQEPKPFIRATLLQAQRLSSDEKTEKRSPTNTMSGRSCYNLQQDLLENVLELWLETRLLTSRRLRDLVQLRYGNTAPSTASTLKGTSWSEGRIDESIADIPATSPSYALIRHQLFAAIEARCAKLSKNIMNELERRVLQRKQVSAFSTFISAVLLLNCAERMTGLFRSYDTSQMTEQQSLSAEQHDSPEGWPFDSTPDKFWHQGHDFAELLNMLLRLRSLPPNTCCLEDGTLTVKESTAQPVNMSGQPGRDQNDEASHLAADWLNPLQLSIRDLWSKVNSPVPQPDEDIEAWDLRFVAELLLPV